MAESESKGCSIFPPSNHEGLQIDSQEQKDPSSSPPLSSSLPSNFDVRGTVRGFGLPRWFAFGLRLLHSKTLAVASSLRRRFSVDLRLWPFGTAAGVLTAVLLAFAYIALRRRRRHRRQPWEGTLEHLMSLIKQRDEKILQLLYQIIRMNEALLTHNGVSAVKSD